MTLRYRADIDGLRAVAVIAVILYHFRIPGFAGGFVGVDVFFVISGFLIASLIAHELEEQRFSLVYFFERRVRRIIPALAVLLFAVSILAFLELFPAAYLKFGQSVAATGVFLSNVEFWREVTDYFAPPALELPLLHTWSLAVEEQFYLLFPPLLMVLAYRPKRWTLVVLAVLVGASFAFAVWCAFAASQAGFYLFPARIWELLLGALIAFGGFPIASNSKVSGALAVLGLGMIGYAIAPYPPLPGVVPLLPCAGAALIIHAGLKDSPLVNRILSTKPIVFVGLISYSLYLWHWPIYVFATYHLARGFSAFESAGLIAASFVIAALSWRFVEQPFRRPGGVAVRGPIFLQAAAIMSVLGVSGVAIYLANGVPQRFTPEVQAALAPQTYLRSLGCEPGQREQTQAGEMCRIGRRDGPATFIVWADSHGLALSPALTRAAELAGRSGLIAAVGDCPPFVGTRYPLRDECRLHNDATLSFIRSGNIDDVILAGRWALHTDGSNYVRYNQSSDVLTPIYRTRSLSLEDTRRTFGEALKETVETLRAMGKRVFIVGPVPEIGMNVPTTLAMRRMRGLAEDFGPSRAQFEARNKTALDDLASLDGAVQRVYPHLMLCTETSCAVAREGKPLYFDDNHLDRFGAETIGAIFEPIFAAHP